LLFYLCLVDDDVASVPSAEAQSARMMPGLAEREQLPAVAGLGSARLHITGTHIEPEIIKNRM
jgi:hypothetical protein